MRHRNTRTSVRQLFVQPAARSHAFALHESCANLFNDHEINSPIVTELCQAFFLHERQPSFGLSLFWGLTRGHAATAPCFSLSSYGRASVRVPGVSQTF